MRKQGGIFRSLARMIKKATERRAFVSPRRVRMEQLEARYVLTLPVPINDFIQTDWDASPHPIQLNVSQNDVNGGSGTTRIMEVNGHLVNVNPSASFAVPTNGPLIHGTLTLLSGHQSFTYTPNTDFTGDESFTYRITNGTVESDEFATVK